jgi:hypothetical protein
VGKKNRGESTLHLYKIKNKKEAVSSFRFFYSLLKDPEKRKNV